MPSIQNRYRSAMRTGFRSSPACSALLMLFGAAAALAEIAPAKPTAPNTVPAFPGAEGFGGFATGGRGGKVLYVDSTADNPKAPAPHTFRWACETETGPRIVVFRTGGLIELARAVEVIHGDLTIAAQTAPGDGICLKGSGLSIQASNVIVRGLRSRAGDGRIGTTGQNRRSLQIIGPASQIILDHCSASWGVDDNMTVYANSDGQAASDFTIQWCMITECLFHSIHQQGNHSAAGTMGGGNIGPFSYHHNLLADNSARNPRVVWGATGEFINNYIFNWRAQATVLEPFNPVKVKKDKRRPEVSRPMLLNFIGNSYLAGSSTEKLTEIHFSHATAGTSIYLKGNIGPSRPKDDPALDESALMMNAKDVYSAKPVLPPSNVSIQSAEDGRAAVLKYAGALLPTRDSVDRRVAQEVEAGTGRIIDSPKDVGGYPDYPAGTPPKDSDNDGMPDQWEEAHQLDKSKANANGHDLDPHYDNLEVYLNGLFPAQK